MAAKAFGSSVATLPLYLASKSLGRCISRVSVASIFGSSGDAKRSLRFQRTVSAPVDLSAWAIEFQDIRSAKSRTRVGSGQRPAYTPSLSALVTSTSTLDFIKSWYLRG